MKIYPGGFDIESEEIRKDYGIMKKIQIMIRRRSSRTRMRHAEQQHAKDMAARELMKREMAKKYPTLFTRVTRRIYRVSETYLSPLSTSQ